MMMIEPPGTRWMRVYTVGEVPGSDYPDGAFGGGDAISAEVDVGVIQAGRKYPCFLEQVLHNRVKVFFMVNVTHMKMCLTYMPSYCTSLFFVYLDPSTTGTYGVQFQSKKVSYQSAS